MTIGDISSTGNSTFGALQSSGASGSIATTTAASAQTVVTSTLTALDAAIKDISTKRADLGAVSNQLTHAVDNLSSIKINAEESRSRILDTDYAQATSNLLVRRLSSRLARPCWLRPTSCLRRCWLCFSNLRAHLESAGDGAFFAPLSSFVFFLFLFALSKTSLL